jgi:hypothetical protein
MRFAFRHVLAGCVVMSALGGGIAWGYTQLIGSQPVMPVVLSGADIGFRMTARKGDTPVGRLVVRVNGDWKEVEFTFALKPVTTQ